MLIRIAVAISDKTNEKKLVMKLTGISIVMKVEFDIALYSENFDKLYDNIENLDIIISDYYFLQKHEKKLGELYVRNNKCLPVVIDPNQENLSKYLVLRPIGYIEDIENIIPENENDKIRSICDLFITITNKHFEDKSGNSVIYITTKHDSYAVSKDSILYCRSDLKYTLFVIESGMIVRKLDKLQNIQENYLWDFKRVHQSFLINPNKIQSIDKNTNEIILSNQTRIPFSRKYAFEVRELFNK